MTCLFCVLCYDDKDNLTYEKCQCWTPFWSLVRLGYEKYLCEWLWLIPAVSTFAKIDSNWELTYGNIFMPHLSVLKIIVLFKWLQYKICSTDEIVQYKYSMDIIHTSKNFRSLAMKKEGKFLTGVIHIFKIKS